ncbi:hypothetical protein SPBR_06036 [Sporothrix brasiliensis 5110]|uniref:Uncharacterized protein n=1 Tax=Sporothrix brasiliensis 5110 TaxID=1398154 RepID=A0A0C2IXZ2_9PEZI|nr:uncharacterized protein SPBR_06036 [Sporothrix brasiliensis 5110]KIH93986.1 hypothetical protein SPBR_06036 [Sporothrix brasiliensis 5110]
MDKTPSLKVGYDALFYAKGTDEYDAWKGRLEGSHFRILEAFVSDHVKGRGPAKLVENDTYGGSYNRVFRFRFASGGGDVAIKVAKPGHSAAALAAEKMMNEAAWMQRIRIKDTCIPVPRVYRSGKELYHESPLRLPYILMDWAEGDNLRDVLARGPPDELQSIILQQLASFHLDLYDLQFEAIGSVANDTPTGPRTRTIARPPLTIDMHQNALGIPNYPTDDWPTEPFTSARAYLDFVAQQQSTQLWTLRNINAPQTNDNENEPGAYHQPDTSEAIARLRFEGRYRFQQLFATPTLCPPGDNLGPFRAFNPDLDTRNMTVHPETGVITGVFDLEFTNGMPAQFASDPPLWLARYLPSTCLDRGYFA